MPKIIPDLVCTNPNYEDDSLEEQQTIVNQFTNLLIIFRKRVLYEPLFISVNGYTFSMVVPSNTKKYQILEVLKKYFTHINRIGVCFSNPSHLDDVPIFLEETPLFLNNEYEPYSDNVQFMIHVIKEFNVTTIDFLASNTLNYNNYLNYYNILSKETNVVVGASNNKIGTINYGSNWEQQLSCAEVNKLYFDKNDEYYKYLYRFPSLANIGRCGTGIVVDTYGNTYVSNSNDNTVSKIDLDNTSITLSIDGWSPYGIAIDSHGNVYTANEKSNNVSKITPSGESTIFAKTENAPLGIVIDANDNIYVTNSRSHNVSKVTPNGVSTIFATTGMNPVGIVIDTKGYIYTANNGGSSISKISPNGESIVFVDNLQRVVFIALDSQENLYASSPECKTIYKITSDGIFIPIQLQNYPMAIALDSLDNIYINFYKTKQIYTIKSENILKMCKKTTNFNCFKSILNKNIELELVGSITGEPGGMIIDKLDNIYITNITRKLLHKDNIFD